MNSRLGQRCVCSIYMHSCRRTKCEWKYSIHCQFCYRCAAWCDKNDEQNIFRTKIWALKLKRYVIQSNIHMFLTQETRKLLTSCKKEMEIFCLQWLATSGFIKWIEYFQGIKNIMQFIDFLFFCYQSSRPRTKW